MGASSLLNRNDPLNNYAQNVVRDSHNKINETYYPIYQQPGSLSLGVGDQPGVASSTAKSQPPPSSKSDQPLLSIHSKHEKIGIIGGGIGGLYAAMLLQKLGIQYEILEASPHLGGRLYTQKMGERPNDYYDVGAMRFPDTPVMRPVFDLFEELQLPLGEYRLKDEAGNSTWLYNDINMRRRDGPVTPEDFKITNVFKKWGVLGWEENVNNVINPFAERLIADFNNPSDSLEEKEGWNLMKKYDKYSMKSYMAGDREKSPPWLDEKRLMPYPMNVVNWCETFDSSSGSYDRALTENVLESLAFSWDGSDFGWKYIVGGSYQLALQLDKHMAAKDGYTRPFFNTRVTGIRCVFEATETTSSGHTSQPVEAAKPSASRSSGTQAGETLPPSRYVAVDLADGRTRCYSHVITTTTLPCLRMMDLTSARLDWPQKQAIRSLQYGPSTKIGVRFRYRWWEDAEWMKKAGAYGPIYGGQSHTDNMSRTVVYPSYGIREPDNGATIIVSYAWTNDALALTGMMGVESRDVLKKRIVKDLVAIHCLNEAAATELEEEFWEDMHAWSWTTNPYTMGAFAHFGPGEFRWLYPALTRPAAGGRLHFAGEVCSARHAWVVGALEASSRAVSAILESSYPDKRAAYEEKFGLPEGWTRELLKTQNKIAMTGVIPEFPPEWQ